MRYPEPRMYLAGQWIADQRPLLPVINPATAERIGSAFEATQGDLDAALDAANRGFEAWRFASPQVKAGVLRGAAALLRSRRDNIASVATVESGKTLRDTRMEADIAAESLEWYAEETSRAYGRVLCRHGQGSRVTVTAEPVGPVAALSTWNFPIANPARKIGAAIAAGCSCILRPASETPASAMALAAAFQEAGLPGDVLSVITGSGSRVATHLLKSSVIRKLSFTGSTAVGRLLGQLAADKIKRITLELGGHAPVIVLPDVDIDRVVSLSVRAKYRNAGQVCTSPTRFLVHADIHEDFVDRFAREASALRVGNGVDEDTELGPLINERRIEAVQGLIDDAVVHGARLVIGGRAIPRAGFFYAPTVLTHVPTGARVMNEEPFGPVAIINSFDDVRDAIREANRTPYGLAAYAFGSDGKTTRHVSESLEAGMVGVNTYTIAASDAPFGGVKESGYGSEMGIEGLEACLVTKLIAEG